MSDQPWYKDGLRFQCKTCGRCCGGGPGYVWVTQEEIDALAARLGLSSPLFEQVFVYTVKGRKRSLKEYPNGDCVLLDDKTRGCKTYQERPIQCKTWPFWPQNLDSPKSWAVTAKYCPGCDQGRLYTLDEIEEQKNRTDLY